LDFILEVRDGEIKSKYQMFGFHLVFDTESQMFDSYFGTEDQIFIVNSDDEASKAFVNKFLI
jgi:hypothetical protein